MPKVDHNFLISAGTSYKIYIAERWHQVIVEYSGLDLSFPSDVLPGISGLAKQMSNAYEGMLGKLFGRTLGTRAAIWAAMEQSNG
jgi:hypothetical protein